LFIVAVLHAVQSVARGASERPDAAARDDDPPGPDSRAQAPAERRSEAAALSSPVGAPLDGGDRPA
jgi:hypothetical protein